jgi:hypothetical protein
MSNSKMRKNHKQSLIKNKASLNSSRQLPPKNSGVRTAKYDNPNSQLSILATKNMHSLVKKDKCMAKRLKDPSSKRNILLTSEKDISLHNTSRHHSSISFSNARVSRISSHPSQENKAHEQHAKYIKTETKVKPDHVASLYNSNGYSSSNIIKMLRVKQEVSTDPRMGLSKEQLLTRLITMEQEYKNLRKENENKMIKNKQFHDYNSLLEISTTNYKLYCASLGQLKSAVSQLCRVNFRAFDLYNKILEDFKDPKENPYDVVDIISNFLNGSDFNMEQYEHIITQSESFMEQCSENISTMQSK